MENEEVKEQKKNRLADAQDEEDEDYDKFEDEENNNDRGLDYKYAGGNFAVCDSALDPTDELLFIVETLERIDS